MALKDFKNLFRSRNTGGESDMSRRPDGGTSCYRPLRKKAGAAPEPQGENPAQPMTYIHTGFTGMNPPAWGGYEPSYAQQDAYGQMDPYGQQIAYAQQNPYGQPAAYAPQNPYEPPQNLFPQAGMQETYGRYTEMSAPAPQSYFPQQATGREERRAAARPERGWFPPREEPKPADNISYMPGFRPAPSQGGFAHVAHIMAVTGLKSCYEAIECMKNAETLIVTLDTIANEGESMRCQDMLAGAAFTLGCTVRMLLGGQLVLIAPEGVHILPEETAAPIRMAPPVYQMPAAVPETVPAGRRERRSGSNAAEWAAARNGELDNYNPYTGTMPAAAGAYGSFGGYGY